MPAVATASLADDAEHGSYYGSSYPASAGLGMHPLPAWAPITAAPTTTKTAFTDILASTATSAAAAAARKYKPSRPAEKGIRIKTRTDRAREQEEKDEKQRQLDMTEEVDAVAVADSAGVAVNGEPAVASHSESPVTADLYAEEEGVNADAGSLALFSGLD